MKYKLGEKLVKLYNPLPAVSMEEVVRDAGLEGLWSNPVGSAFELQFVWSQGPEREEIVIKPGEYVELPITIANHAFSQLQGDGLIMLVRNAKTGEWPEAGSDLFRQKCLEGLQRAKQFFMLRGTIPLSKARVRHGIQSDEQWESIKIKFKGGLINKAREARIDDERKRLLETRPVQPVKTTPPKVVVA
jgi:hypothetical protein